MNGEEYGVGEAEVAPQPRTSGDSTHSRHGAMEELPQTFQVKYLGHRETTGLWGIKYTRRPVDNMVSAARSMKPGTVLPLVKVEVSTAGVKISSVATNRPEQSVNYAIDTISYGVQDLVYTRVFSMIVVREGKLQFDCHAFVCESRAGARRLTYALAAAFQEYSRSVKGVRKRAVIDLRSPEEMQLALKEEDSEA